MLERKSDMAGGVMLCVLLALLFMLCYSELTQLTSFLLGMLTGFGIGMCFYGARGDKVYRLKGADPDGDGRLILKPGAGVAIINTESGEIIIKEDDGDCR